MRRYETTIIIDPALDQPKIDEIVSKYEEMIKSDGEIIEIENWGKKRLAYPIKKKPTGYYTHYKYNAGSEIPKVIERDFNLNADILRFMTIVTDKRAMKQEELDKLAPIDLSAKRNEDREDKD
ncbi:MAG: 30S ribosomal protein S6 [Candidatus Delongbacteria bacterium]|nr:30S ribosomal protein S6 [Candidatus Delongbacteria bacterium]